MGIIDSKHLAPVTQYEPPLIAKKAAKGIFLGTAKQRIEAANPLIRLPGSNKISASTPSRNGTP